MLNETVDQSNVEDVIEPGTRWLVPQSVAIEILHPSLLTALEQRGDTNDFQGFITRIYDMPHDIANGSFHIAVNLTTSEAVGLHTVSMVLGEKYREEIELAIGPIWVDAGGEDEAATELYAILKDVGRLA